MNLKRLPFDELLGLHREVCELLDKKMTGEVEKLQGRIDILRKPKVKVRKPYPPVPQRYQNPNEPLQTWSGRGRQPRWLAALLDHGGSIEDFEICRAGTAM
jgi:DNA-binding protein H-NS